MPLALRRIPAFDAVLTALFAALGVLLMVENIDDTKVHASPLVIPFFLLVSLPLLWRRTATLWVLAAITAAIWLHVLLFGNVVRCGAAFPVLFVGAYTAGSRLDRREALIGLGIAVVGVIGVGADDGQVDIGFAATGIVALTAVLWGLGRFAHSRQALAGELADKTADLQRARDDRAKLEVSADRARLSGELDALLQQRLAELAREAEAGAQATDADAARASLAAIEEGSRDTLQQMRALVGVLRSDDDDAPVSPQPTLTHLEGMLVRGGHADAHLRVEGTPRVLPPGVELAAFRIVEHLLETIDDGPDVDVTVRFADGALELEVAGPPSRRPSARDARAKAVNRAAVQHGRVESDQRDGRAHTRVALPVAVPA